MQIMNNNKSHINVFKGFRTTEAAARVEVVAMLVTNQVQIQLVTYLTT